MLHFIVESAGVTMSGTHILTSAFPIDINDVGGLATALGVARERAGGAETDVTLLAPDSEGKSYDGFKVVSSDPLKPGERDRWTSWFGTGYCPTFFSRAFTQESLPADALPKIYRQQGLDASAPVGTQEYLREYVEAHVDRDALDSFATRFVRPLTTLPELQAVNYQSFFFDRVIARCANELRQQGVFQTVHIHEAIPTDLTTHRFGREFLTALCGVDAIYFHNETFIERFRSQAEMLGLKSPQLSRFDLGVETEFIKRSLDTIAPGNLNGTIPEYDTMTASQKRLITDAFALSNTDVHPFFCIDRIDPVKGNHIVYLAIDKFLEAELSRGQSLEQLKEKYRFYFLQKPALFGDDNPVHLTRNYVAYASALLNSLEQKYPGIIITAEPLSGPHRSVLPALLNNASCLNASISEGLNLAVPEAAVANHLGNGIGSIVLGSEAGFAMRLREMRKEHLGQFPTSGSVDDFLAALIEIDHKRRHYPQAVRDRNAELVEGVIMRRQDSLIVPKPS